MSPFKFVDGYKTYAVGFATVAFGVYQFSQGDIHGATTNILLGLGVLFGRHAIQKLECKVNQ